MKISHQQARRRFETALDTAHYYGRKPELDPDLTEHLAGCRECQAYTEQAAAIDTRLAHQLPQSWQVPNMASTRIDAVVRKVQSRARRKRMIRFMTTTTRRVALLAGSLVLIAGLVLLLNNLLFDRPVPLADPTNTAISPSVDDEKVSISFAAYMGLGTQYEALIEIFETEHPDINVHLIPIGGEAPNLEMLVSQADTILLGSAISPSSSELFLDLAPLIASEGFDEDSFWPGALQGCQVVEAQKGLPVHLGPRLVLYNKAAFDHARVAYPQPDWTWDDFRAAVQTLSNPQGTPHMYGFLAPNPLSLLGPLIDARLESGQDAAGLASDLEWYVELSRQGAITAQQDSTSLIRQGQAAMWLGTLSSFAFDYQGLGFDVGVAPFPADPQAAASTSMNVSCAVISAGTQNPAASYAWLTYISQNPPPDLGSYFAPASTAAAEAQGYWEQLVPETAESVRYTLEQGWYGWVMKDFSPIGEALATATTTEQNLETLLATAITKVSMQVESPTTKATPVAVIPPTPTEEPAVIPTDGLSAIYYADQGYHTSQKDIIALAEEFNRSYPGMHIEVATQRIDFENINSVMYDVENFDCFAAPGAVIDDPDFAEKVYILDPLLETGDVDFLNDMNPDFLNAAYLDGSLHGIPVAIQPYFVYYNTALLQALGLEPPSENWTVEDFWSLASEAASQGNDIYGYVPHGSQPIDFLSDVSYLDMTGSWSKANFDSPDVTGLLNQLAPLVNNRTMFLYESGGTRSPMGNYMGRDEIIQFSEGLLWIDTPGMPLVTHIPDEVDVATLPIPQTLDQSSTAFLYISRRAENPQVCWQWIEYLEEQSTSVFQGIPVRQSILESDSWAASVGEQQAKVYRSTMASLEVKRGINVWPPMPLNQWWNDALYLVLVEGQDAETVLRTIQYKAQATLECMQAAGVPASLPYDESSYEIANTCAHEVDPEYLNPSELWSKQATQ